MKILKIALRLQNKLILPNPKIEKGSESMLSKAVRSPRKIHSCFLHSHTKCATKIGAICYKITAVEKTLT